MDAFFLPYKYRRKIIQSPRAFLVGAFTSEQKADSCSDFVLRTQWIVYFFPNFFPQNNILKNASTVYNEHGQVLTNTKRCLFQNFSALWDKKIVCKNLDTPRYV